MGKQGAVVHAGPTQKLNPATANHESLPGESREHMGSLVAHYCTLALCWGREEDRNVEEGTSGSTLGVPETRIPLGDEP